MEHETRRAASQIVETCPIQMSRSELKMQIFLHPLASPLFSETGVFFPDFTACISRMQTEQGGKVSFREQTRRVSAENGKCMDFSMLRSYTNYLLHQFPEEFNSNLFRPCLHNIVRTFPWYYLAWCDGFHKRTILIFPKILEKAGQSTELGLNDSVSVFCEAPVQCGAFTGRGDESLFSDPSGFQRWADGDPSERTKIYLLPPATDTLEATKMMLGLWVFLKLLLLLSCGSMHSNSRASDSCKYLAVCSSKAEGCAFFSPLLVL